MRPVERSSALGELMQALQTHMMLLDEVVGASRMNMGLPQGPRKSAAEASILAQAGSRRSRDRLSVMADLFSASATAAFAFQRSAYGKVVKFPTKSALCVPYLACQLTPASSRSNYPGDSCFRGA
jgi:hypothetical protein